MAEQIINKSAFRKRTWLIALIVALATMIGMWAIGAEDTYAGEYDGKVYFNLSEDGKPVMSDVTGDPMMMVEVDLQDVADVDLAEWGYEEYAYQEWGGDGTQYPERPTVLKLFLLMHERYKDDPTGSINVTQSTFSAYCTRFWDHDENLNYYVNGAYPLYEEGKGATCDAIALEDGDRVDVMMFSDWSFWGDAYAGFNFFADADSDPEDGAIVGSYDAKVGEPLPVQVIRGWGSLAVGGATEYQAADDLTIHVSEPDGAIDADHVSDLTLDGGKAELTFDQPGKYYIWVDGGVGEYGSVVQSGAAAIVNVEGGPDNVIPIGFSTSNGSIDSVTITDGSNNPINGAQYKLTPGNAGVYTIDVTLPKSYSSTGSVKAVFKRTPNASDYPYVTPNDNKWAGVPRNQTYGGRTDTYSATLSNGAATSTAYIYEGNSRQTGSKKGTVTIKYEIENKIPRRADGVAASVNETMVAMDSFELDLSTIFTDDDGDDLTYKVKIGSAAAVAADKNYSFTTTQTGDYTLVFTANDGLKDSTETYTVNLKVERKAGTYYVTHENGTGYSTQAAAGSSSPVNEGDDYTVELKLTDGYKRGSDFAVKANGTVVEEDSEGSNLFTVKNVQADQKITVEGVTEMQPVIIAPAKSTISIGYQTGYFKKIWIDPVKVETLDDGRVKNTYAPVSNAQLFYRIQNPDGVTYYKYITALSRGQTIEVSGDKLFIGDSSFTKKSALDKSGNIADVYLPINAAGYIDMEEGKTGTMNCFRNWLPVGDTINNNKEGIPDFHYEVVDEEGNESDLVTITPDTHNSGVTTIKAGNDTGMAIVKVTYDAMYIDDNRSFGPKFGAIWPERTGVFVVTVGQNGTGIKTNMKIDLADGSSRNIDAEHDPLFYFGNEGAEYSFKPEEGTAVTVARPTLDETSLNYDGFSSAGVKTDDEGNVTVSGLKAGRNIVKVEKDGLATYQVITARKISYTAKDGEGKVIAEGGKVNPGDKVTISFSDLTSPSEKFSGKYNYNFRVGLKDEKGTLFQEASPGGYGVYNFTTRDHELTVTVPEDWTKATYKLTTGSILKGGFAGGDGTHRTSSYGAGGSMAWGTEGTGATAYGNIVELPIKVQQPPARKEGVEAEATEEVSQGDAYSVGLSGIFTDPNGDDLTYTVSVNGADPVAADENYSYKPEGTDPVTLEFKANDGTAESTDTYKVNITIKEHTHVWGEPEWTWNEDNTEAKAKFTCTDNAAHTEEKSAKITSEKDTDGNRVYTAKVKFDGKDYVDTKTKTIDETKATVDFTSQSSGGFLHAPQFGVEVSSKLAESYGYTDDVDGGVSVLDVLVAAHVLVYGDEFTAESAQEYLVMKKNNPTMQFGVDGNQYLGGFFYNRAMANDGTMLDSDNWFGTLVGTQKVVDGDLVEFFFYEDDYYGDTYNWFTDADGKYGRSFSVCEDEDLELTLKGFFAMNSSIFKDEEEMTSSDVPEVIEDAQIYTVDLETGELTALAGAVTDEDGAATIRFSKPGTYTIAAYGTDDCMFTQLLSLTTVKVNAHVWGETEYTWAADNSSVTAKRICTIDDSHIETETAETTGAESKAPTCEEKGETTYTSKAFTNSAFKTQTKTLEDIEALDHDWDEGEETTAADCENAGVMTYTCKRDSSHERTEAINAKGHSWNADPTVDRKATCEKAGEQSIHCGTCNAIDADTIEEIPAKGHAWGEVTYTWSDDNSKVTASRLCGNDDTHVDSEAVAAKGEKTKDPTCDEKGETTYTSAAFTNEAFAKQTKTEADIPAKGHKWGEWSVHTEATEEKEGLKKRACDHDPTHEDTGIIPRKASQGGGSGTATKPTTKPTTTKKTTKPATAKATTKPATTKKKTKPAAKSTARRILVARAIAKGKVRAEYSWNKVSGADRYVIYMGRCDQGGKKYPVKKVKTLNAKTTRWTSGKLKKNTAYKFYVVAQKKVNGKFTNIARSLTGHYFTGNVRGKYTNPKSIKLNRSAIVLKKGKSATIKGTVSRVKTKKAITTGHEKLLRYLTSDPGVATVNANGKVTAKKAGRCTIYVQTINGIWNTCRVIVK